jgi:hypothetical protein
MTAEQIIKALERHLSVGRDCYQATCPLIDDEKCRVTLKNVVMTFVKDMLAENRGLKTALETLKGVVESYEHHNDNLLKENKYLRERLAEEMEHAKDVLNKSQ